MSMKPAVSMMSRAELDGHMLNEHGGAMRGGTLVDLWEHHRLSHENQGVVFGSYHTHEDRYSPDQERDDHGRWGVSGASNVTDISHDHVRKMADHHLVDFHHAASMAAQSVAWRDSDRYSQKEYNAHQNRAQWAREEATKRGLVLVTPIHPGRPDR